MGYKLIETRLASQDLDNILEYMASACKILRLQVLLQTPWSSVMTSWSTRR